MGRHTCISVSSFAATFYTHPFVSQLLLSELKYNKKYFLMAKMCFFSLCLISACLIGEGRETQDERREGKRDRGHGQIIPHMFNIGEKRKQTNGQEQEQEKEIAKLRVKNLGLPAKRKLFMCQK